MSEKSKTARELVLDAAARVGHLVPEKLNPDLGWVFIDRENHKDLAIQYDTLTEACRALEDDILVEHYCQEDAIDAWAQDQVTFEHLKDREIVIAKEQQWLIL